MNHVSIMQKISIAIMTIMTLFFMGCDERIAVDEDANYTISLIHKAFVGSTMAQFSDENVVCEDVVGQAISTLIEAKLTDEDGKAVKGKTIYFSARQGNSSYGSFDLDEGETGADGTISVVYEDGTGSGAVDISSTDAFEGVTVTAKVSDSFSADTQFDVYGSQNDVWPYVLSLSADANSIIMDGSATDVDLTLTLSNKLGSAGGNMNVTLTADKGGFNTDGLNTTSVLMDETGKGSLTFDENYSQDDLGIATIIASYTHQGFSESVHDTIFVSISDMYQVAISHYFFSYDDGSNIVLVGEDIAGEYAQTMLVATVTDSANAPVGGIDLSFSSTVMGAEAGTITAMSNVTDLSGRIYAIFDDGGNSYKDTPGTPSFEGVTATARYGENLQVSTSFNVYEQNDVWPYTLNVSTNTDVIYVDGGETKATVTSYMINAMGHPAENALISYESTLGYIIPGDGDYKTDSTGVDSVFFTDAGDPEDVGLATLVASYTHAGFGATVSNTTYISISDIYTVQMNTYSGGFNDNNEFVLVGEDIAGDYAQTLLVASVTDPANNPVSGVELTMSTKVSGEDVGTITYLNSVTDSEGLIRAIFDDGGNSYSDTPGTPSFEGVVASASYGNNDDVSVQFNVYNQEDVWPYSLIMTSDIDVIYIDGGETKAKITTRLLNSMGNPVENVLISYESTLGFIPSVGNETDSTGVDSVEFTDLGDPNEVGVSEVTGSFIHPGFPDDNISNSLEIYIEDQSFQACAFIEIPPSNPGQIVVRDGGGVESTTIKAEIYDDAGNLIDTPTPVTFKLNPVLSGSFLEDSGETEVTIYTVNGVATVSVNSGTEPGVIRIEVDVDCDEDGNVDLSASKSQAIIAAGAPYHIEPEYDPQSTESIGGGFYQTEVGAIVYDKWYNPVECSTYVYWTIDPTPPDTLIDAFVQGISYTCNENMNSDTYDGVAYSSITYSTDAIGDIGLVSATTFGANGDTITAQINEGDGDAVMFFVPGELTLLASTQYWDFTLPIATDEAEITITAMLIDYYGNPVVDAPIAFSGMGVSEWREVGYEAYTDGSNGLAADGCFTWRDYGADDDPETLDMGTFNNLHDALDTTGNGDWDVSEVSEDFDDFGLDGIDATFDEGEGNGEWDGYPMINCGPLVLTDKDGFARITAVFPKELCLWQSTDDESGLCTFEDFTGSISATLMIPQQTTSDPIDIQLVRSQTNVGCP